MPITSPSRLTSGPPLLPALAQVGEYDATTHPLNGMARYLNVGTDDYPFHPHGNNGLVIGRDGYPL